MLFPFKMFVYVNQVANKLKEIQKSINKFEEISTSIRSISNIDCIYVRIYLELGKVIIFKTTSLASNFWEHKYIFWELNRIKELS